MKIAQFTPAQAFFYPRHPIKLKFILAADQTGKVVLRVNVSQLAVDVMVLEQELTLKPGENIVNLLVPSPSDTPQSYGLCAVLYDQNGQMKDLSFSAVDTLMHWTDFPRYGFLTDFSPDRTDIDTALDTLMAYHINGLQFYDWQYRHDTLIPPQDDFTDPLGRSLSIKTVRNLLAAAHSRRMAAMPYLAVYAASLSFWESHPRWQLFDEQDQPLKFEDFLGLMNPAPASPWVNYLAQQCEDVLSQISFDGLHVDQYGKPKTAFDSEGKAVNIPQAFKAFINRLKSTFPTKSVVFNAVGNWPIDEIASAQVDFVYIEIWPPDCAFQDLQRIVTEAREKSGNKPVVIALYLPADQLVNIRIANAVIIASGGSRIELGENGRLLADPYFPKHETRSPELVEVMKKYQDFLVRYGQLLGPMAVTETESGIALPPDTLGTLRKNENWWAVNVINLAGLEAPRWDKAQPAPTPRVDFPFTLPMSKKPKEIWVASPDAATPEMEPLPFIFNRGNLIIRLPKLVYWSMILIQFENKDL